MPIIYDLLTSNIERRLLMLDREIASMQMARSTLDDVNSDYGMTIGEYVEVLVVLQTVLTEELHRAKEAQDVASDSQPPTSGDTIQ